jgi:hypothetical protein
MGWPVVVVAKGGIPVTEASAGLGTPLSIATNGYGTAVTVVGSGGLPVVGSGGGGAVAPGDPVTIFTQSPAVAGSDSNPNVNFRTSCVLAQNLQDEFRITLQPGANMSCMGLAAGNHAGGFFPSSSVPMVLVKFAGADGFTNQSTPQTSDWTPSGTLAGMLAGNRLIISFMTGPAGQGLVAYTAGSTNSTCMWQSDDGTLWDDQTVLGYNDIGATIYGAVKIETRTAGSGGGTEPPVPPGDGILPMSFNDPMFTGMTELTAPIVLLDGQNLTRTSIQERTGDPSLTVAPTSVVTYCRILSRETTRVGIASPTFDHCYMEALGEPDVGDHADTVQHFVSLTAGSRETTVTWKNSHLVGHLVDATATYFWGDDWAGRLVLENVIINGGPIGCKFNAAPDAYTYINFKDVFFVGPFGNVPIQDNASGNSAWVIERWENVKMATIVNGVLVPGVDAPQMVSTPLPTNLVTKSSAFDQWTAVNVTVTTGIEKDPVFWEAGAADRFTETATTATHILASNSISFTSGTAYTFSLYVKSEVAAAKFLQLALPTAAFGVNAWGNFDISAMTVQTKGAAATTTVRLPRDGSTHGWSRVTITATATATAAGTVAICGIPAATSTRAFSYLGVITNTRRICNAQVETGAIDRPYVKTA